MVKAAMPISFGYLLAIYVDAAGNVYAADNGISGKPVSRVQKWAPGAANGITVAGGHSSGRMCFNIQPVLQLATMALSMYLTVLTTQEYRNIFQPMALRI